MLAEFLRKVLENMRVKKELATIFAWKKSENCSVLDKPARVYI